ncbi:NAD(P)-binding protein [Brachyspira sp.]|uniref:NAD(P)-binding protein n=1 Tax=Brachyspira sp. TaxID=1977261 RepID=UPI002627E911|nr:NAD(P)-binding protein [Brachyspira sp.]
MIYDYIIIGAGIYGIYLADIISSKYKNVKILIIEKDREAFLRASYVNQARLHNGYHYPRSLHTAIKCSHYFDKFAMDYEFSIIKNFTKIYAVSSKFGMSTPDNFEYFCDNANIPYKKINELQFFNVNLVDACYETKEYAVDTLKIKEYYLEKINENKNITIIYDDYIKEAYIKNSSWYIRLNSNKNLETSFVINTSYASINSVLKIFNLDTIPIKFELSEMILCEPSNNLKGFGITLMDGPFFSIMPFNKNGLYSLYSVRYSPHKFSTSELPHFECQLKSNTCNGLFLDNCNLCEVRPNSSWIHMRQLAKKYLKSEFLPEFKESILTIKALMQSSSTSDSRPVIIKKNRENPHFITVLGGKLNTIYELNEVIL